MNLFNKNFKSGYEELLTYYPDFYKNVYEMNAILKAQGQLVDNLESGIEQVFFNCFIDTADKNVIACYERMIGIASEDLKSLEERRSLVKSHLVGTGKISASLIKEMIRIYTGADSECRFENSILKIDIDRGDKNYINFGDIEKLLSTKLPAHIKFRTAISYTKKLEISCRLETNNLKLPTKSIAVSHNVKIGSVNYPRCGLHYCDQKNMF